MLIQITWMTEHLYDISATELLSHSILDSEKTLISLKKKKKPQALQKYVQIVDPY